MLVNNGVLLSGMGCYSKAWGVSKRDGVLVNNGVLLSGMGCYSKAWGVSKRDGVLVNGMGC